MSDQRLSKENRKKAVKAGEKHYISGTPCKKCGSLKKYVSSYGCVKCNIERNLGKLYDEELMKKYRTKEKRQVWIDKNPDTINSINKRYRDKPSTKERCKKYYEKNKKELNEKRIYRIYGISYDEYEKLLVSQNNVCGICGKPCRTGRSLAVDHCHQTGKVRGLLCSVCNRALGMFSDDPKILQQAINYLKKDGV